MFSMFLRENAVATYLLTAMRLYLGFGWMMAGFGKVAGGSFDASGFLQGAVAKSVGENAMVPGWWAGFLESFAIPNVGLFNFLVPWGEFLVGLALILGLFTNFATLMAVTMNLAYLLSAAISSNPTMLLMEMMILIGGYNASKLGLDVFVARYIKGKLGIDVTDGSHTKSNAA